jgi:hypothetical protein
VDILEKKVENKFEENKNELSTKGDMANLRSELSKTIYLTSLGQLVTMIASVISIVWILKK